MAVMCAFLKKRVGRILPLLLQPYILESQSVMTPLADRVPFIYVLLPPMQRQYLERKISDSNAQNSDKMPPRPQRHESHDMCFLRSEENSGTLINYFHQAN